MTKMIKKVQLESPASTMTSVDPTKGTLKKPYTLAEKVAFPEGQWPGGYVEGIGYVASFDPWGSSSSEGSGSNDWSDFYAALNNILQSLPVELSSLVSSEKVHILPDPTRQSGGYYNSNTKQIFLSPNSVNITSVRHELIHAWEDDEGFITGTNSHGNNEFETYVMNDVAGIAAGHGCGSATLGFENSGPYLAFLNSCFKDNKPFDRARFKEGIIGFFSSFLAVHPDNYDSNYQWHWDNLLTLFGL